MRIILVVVCLLLGAASARASAITYQVAGGPGGYGGGTLSQFDPSLGTLNGVSYGLNGSVLFSLTNTTASPLADYIVNFSIELVLNGTGLSTKSASVTDDGDLFFNFASSSDPLPPGTSTLLESGSVVRLADLGLAPFIGIGTIDLTVDRGEDSDLCFSELDFGTNHTSIACGRTPLNFVASVTYSYTPDPKPVPEPLSFALVGLGLVAITMAMRRRQEMDR